jgi:peptidoglycan/LPS O-acetylase OafA/YrhL
MKYPSNHDSRRLDIDLLRALAVLAVIFYHFEVPGFSGGFLGVDIFFVISGYLISLHIQEQIDGSGFSFLYFYLRRIRRLYPAYLGAMILTSIGAFALLPHALLADFTHSQIASSIYLSNIYFWSKADYFDTESILKPLLHTWSLSVEEQFYILWPLFLVWTAAWRKRAILIAGTLSLLAAELYNDHAATTVFYMLPFRVFEFSIGALACHRSLASFRYGIQKLLILTSLLVIALTLTLVDSSTATHGFLAFPLCLATATIIVLRHEWLNRDGRMLRILQHIGLISYSAYLVHWPLVVFYKIENPLPLSAGSIVFLLAVTWVLAELFYRYIERPTSRIHLAKGKLLLLMTLPVTFLVALGFEIARPVIYRYLNPSDYSVKHILDSIPSRQSVLKKQESLIAGKLKESDGTATRTIVVLGDSHAVDVTLSLKYLLAGSGVAVEIFHSICDPLTLASIDIPLEQLYGSHSQVETHNPEYCRNYHRDFITGLAHLSPDLVVFSEAWRPAALPYLRETIQEIKTELAVDVLILGRNPQFSPHPNIVFKDLKDIDDINAVAWNRRYKVVEEADAILAEIARDTESWFIPKNDIVCPYQKCTLLIDNAFGYTDDQHWSNVGMEYYGNLLLSHERFKAAMKGW